MSNRTLHQHILKEEVYVVKFTLRMLRNNVTYHKRAKTAHSAHSIIKFENEEPYKQHGIFIRLYFTRKRNRIKSNLMTLALLLHYLLLNMFRMLVHPSSGACELLWIYFMCCIALVRCVLVLRCGSAGVVWYAYAG